MAYYPKRCYNFGLIVGDPLKSYFTHFFFHFQSDKTYKGSYILLDDTFL